jgi:hypothetical protein
LSLESQESIGRGEFDNLPDTGKPLASDDDTLVLPELRAAYRVLKNAGYVPCDLQLRSEISDLEAFLATVDDSPSRERPISDSTICVHSYKPLAVIRPTLGLSMPTIGSCSIGLTNNPFFSGEPA